MSQIALKYHQQAIPVIWTVKKAKGELEYPVQRNI